MSERRKLIKDLTQAQINQGYNPEPTPGYVVIKGQRYVVNPTILPADPEQLAKDFEGDMLNDVASCECGETIGAHNLGVTCKFCGTEVKMPVLRDPVLRRVPKMRDPIGEYIHTYGHPPIAISAELKAEIDKAREDHEKAIPEYLKKAIEDPNAEWHPAFTPKKEGE
jgi:hypothetical protein